MTTGQEKQDPMQEFTGMLRGASEAELSFIKSLLVLFIHKQALETGALKLRGKDIDIDLSTN